MAVISDIITRVRQATNESAVDAKYTDAVVLSLLEEAWPVVLSEINRISKHPVIVRHNIALGSSATEYVLPPHVGEVLWFGKISADTGLVIWEVKPRSLWNPYGPVVSFEGNILKLVPNWDESHTLELAYVPNGDISLWNKTSVLVAATDATSPAISSPTTGTIDQRTNSYAGYILSATDATGRVEERIVTSSSADGNGQVTLNVSPDFTLDVTAADWGLTEIAPLVMTKRLKLVLALYVSKLILAFEEYPKRVQLVEAEYIKALRSIRLDASKYENRVGSRFQKDTRDNRKYFPAGEIYTW